MEDESKMLTVVLLTHQNATHANYNIKSKLKANAVFKVLPLLRGCIVVVCYLHIEIRPVPNRM